MSFKTMNYRDAQLLACGCSCCTLQREKDAAWEQLKGEPKTINYADMEDTDDTHPGSDPIPDYECTGEPHETICPSCERHAIRKTTIEKHQLNSMYGKKAMYTGEHLALLESYEKLQEEFLMYRDARTKEFRILTDANEAQLEVIRKLCRIL